MCSETPVFPFCAVVGHESAQKALLLSAVNPALNGVLLTGEPGTSKTTLIQGLAHLLPGRKQIVVPLHVDDDRLLGGWEWTASLRSGERSLSPGLLAAANGQLVTLDEVNLMSERTLRQILAAVESGGVQAKGEGAADWQPSSFLLLATMNPEEARLSPALLDRFAIYIPVKTSADSAERAEIARRRLAFERDQVGFVRSFEPETMALREQILHAGERLPNVDLTESTLRLAAEIALEAGCAGHRADLLLVEAARTLAAWEGRQEVGPEHLREAASLVLPHRMRPSDEAGQRQDAPAPQEQKGEAEGGSEQPEREGASSPLEAKADGSSGSGDATEAQQPCPQPDEAADDGEAPGAERGPDEESAPGIAARAIIESVGREFDVCRIAFTPPRSRFKAQAGKRNQAAEGGRMGRYVRAEKPRGALSDLAFDATLRSAAPYQQVRQHYSQAAENRGHGPRLLIERSDLRVKVRESRTGTALLFVVDASGSMNAAKRMKAVKGAVLSLLQDAYRQRDSVGLVAFRDSGAELLLDITRSVELAERQLKSMPVGGRTPLLAGLKKGAMTLEAMLRKGSGLIPAMVIMTDGKANAGVAPGIDMWQEIRRLGQWLAKCGIQTLVIDTEQGFVRLGYARKLADCLQARCIRLEELDAGQIARAARSLTEGR